MKVYIPEKIYKNLNKIKKIFLEISYQNIDLSFEPLRNEISIKHISKINFIHLINVDFKKIKLIQLRVIYLNDICEVLKYSSIFEAINKRHVPKEEDWVRCKGKWNASYEDSYKVLQQFNSIKDIENKKNKIKNKNLIYYTVYFDSGYVDLLELSINSIKEKSKINFDILIITDQATKELILKREFFKKKKLKFFITETPQDSWEASQNKLLIYDYKKINLYNKVLFLDCDIICSLDISYLFDMNLHDGVLYTASPENISYEDHLSFYYGFPFLGESHMKEMKNKYQMPFNAGQFLFKNCWEMQNNFNKINKLIKMWVGEYFFEQCFMNYYFCTKNLTNFHLLKEHISIITIEYDKVDTIKKYPLIHFSAPPANARRKIDFIKKYLDNERSCNLLQG